MPLNNNSFGKCDKIGVVNTIFSVSSLTGDDRRLRVAMGERLGQLRHFTHLSQDIKALSHARFKASFDGICAPTKAIEAVQISPLSDLVFLSLNSSLHGLR